MKKILYGVVLLFIVCLTVGATSVSTPTPVPSAPTLITVEVPIRFQGVACMPAEKPGEPMGIEFFVAPE